MPTAKIPTNGDAYYDGTIGATAIDVDKIEALVTHFDNHRNRQSYETQIKSEITAANASVSLTDKLNGLARAIGLATLSENGNSEPPERQCVYYIHPDPDHEAYEYVTGATGNPNGNIKKVIAAVQNVRGHIPRKRF